MMQRSDTTRLNWDFFKQYPRTSGIEHCPSNHLTQEQLEKAAEKLNVKTNLRPWIVDHTGKICFHGDFKESVTYGSERIYRLRGYLCHLGIRFNPEISYDHWTKSISISFSDPFAILAMSKGYFSHHAAMRPEKGCGTDEASSNMPTRFGNIR